MTLTIDFDNKTVSCGHYVKPEELLNKLKEIFPATYREYELIPPPNPFAIQYNWQAGSIDMSAEHRFGGMAYTVQDKIISPAN